MRLRGYLLKRILCLDGHDFVHESDRAIQHALTEAADARTCSAGILKPPTRRAIAGRLIATLVQVWPSTRDDVELVIGN
jgi:hypothetical protein